MKREDVKNKIPGITDEQLNWLMQENGADINREKSAATALTKATVYEKIVDARTQLSNTYVPTGGRPQGRTAKAAAGPPRRWTPGNSARGIRAPPCGPCRGSL